jgi:NAD(P)-dependent dehydrogenase (short-subunit alcohol dehydrogenase family)
LKGRSALVTGAGKGLGRAIALALAEAGANVGLISRTRTDLEQVAAEVERMGRLAMVIPADATNSAEIDAAFTSFHEVFSRLDIVVHAVGRSQRKAALHLSNEEWHAMLDANLTSTFFVCRAAARLMIQAGGGSIIPIASAAGLRGRPNNAAYSAAKAGVINLARALAMEWAPDGIRVNVLAPGRFLTPLTESEMSDPDKYAAFIKNVPLGRIGKPEELREIAVWLASDASSFVTGSVIVIDGGQTLL